MQGNIFLWPFNQSLIKHNLTLVTPNPLPSPFIFPIHRFSDPQFPLRRVNRPPSIYFVNVFFSKQASLSSSSSFPFPSHYLLHFPIFSKEPPLPPLTAFPRSSSHFVSRKSFKLLLTVLSSLSHVFTSLDHFTSLYQTSPFLSSAFPFFILVLLLLPPFHWPRVFLLFLFAPRSSPAQRRFTRLRNSRGLRKRRKPGGDKWSFCVYAGEEGGISCSVINAEFYSGRYYRGI